MLKFLFDFQGRIRRTHYFLGVIVVGLIQGVCVGINLGHLHHTIFVNGYDYDFAGLLFPPGFGIFANLLATACIWVHLALAAKRWHDIGTTGWLAVLSLIPGVNFFIFLALCLVGPGPGADVYGDDPRS